MRIEAQQSRQSIQRGLTLRLCADQPLHLHAAIAADSPDAGADAPDASVGATSPGQASKGGGCSSGAAPTGMLAIMK